MFYGTVFQYLDLVVIATAFILWKRSGNWGFGLLAVGFTIQFLSPFGLLLLFQGYQYPQRAVLAYFEVTKVMFVFCFIVGMYRISGIEFPFRSVQSQGRRPPTRPISWVGVKERLFWTFGCILLVAGVFTVLRQMGVLQFDQIGMPDPAVGMAAIGAALACFWLALKLRAAQIASHGKD